LHRRHLTCLILALRDFKHEDEPPQASGGRLGARQPGGGREDFRGSFLDRFEELLRARDLPNLSANLSELEFARNLQAELGGRLGLALGGDMDDMQGNNIGDMLLRGRRRSGRVEVGTEEADLEFLTSKLELKEEYVKRYRAVVERTAERCLHSMPSAAKVFTVMLSRDQKLLTLLGITLTHALQQPWETPRLGAADLSSVVDGIQADGDDANNNGNGSDKDEQEDGEDRECVGPEGVSSELVERELSLQVALLQFKLLELLTSILVLGHTAVSTAAISKRGVSNTPFLQGLVPAHIGMRVRRGLDWNYGEQDGGEGKTGTVTKVDDAQPGVVEVQWETNSRQNNYHWGYRNKFDLLPLDGIPTVQTFEEGTEVEAQAKRDFDGLWTTSWYRGTIISKNPDTDTYDIRYEDGDHGKGVYTARIRSLIEEGDVVTVHTCTPQMEKLTVARGLPLHSNATCSESAMGGTPGSSAIGKVAGCRVVVLSLEKNSVRVRLEKEDSGSGENTASSAGGSEGSNSDSMRSNDGSNDGTPGSSSGAGTLLLLRECVYKGKAGRRRSGAGGSSSSSSSSAGGLAEASGSGTAERERMMEMGIPAAIMDAAPMHSEALLKLIFEWYFSEGLSNDALIGGLSMATGAGNNGFGQVMVLVRGDGKRDDGSGHRHGRGSHGNGSIGHPYSRPKLPGQSDVPQMVMQMRQQLLSLLLLMLEKGEQSTVEQMPTGQVTRLMMMLQPVLLMDNDRPEQLLIGLRVLHALATRCPAQCAHVDRFGFKRRIQRLAASTSTGGLGLGASSGGGGGGARSARGSSSPGSSSSPTRGAAGAPLRDGDRVRIKRSVADPSYGWGVVSHESVGQIVRILGDASSGRTTVSVRFPQHSSWTCRLSELERVEDTILPQVHDRCKQLLAILDSSGVEPQKGPIMQTVLHREIDPQLGQSMIKADSDSKDEHRLEQADGASGSGTITLPSSSSDQTTSFLRQLGGLLLRPGQLSLEEFKSHHIAAKLVRLLGSVREANVCECLQELFRSVEDETDGKAADGTSSAGNITNLRRSVLGKLLQVLQQTIASEEALSVHLYRDQGFDSMKMLSQPFEITLKPCPESHNAGDVGGRSGDDGKAVSLQLTGAEQNFRKLLVQPLAATAEVQNQILRSVQIRGLPAAEQSAAGEASGGGRTSPSSSTRSGGVSSLQLEQQQHYWQMMKGLVGATVVDKPAGALNAHKNYREATVIEFDPSLGAHLLRYTDGGNARMSTAADSGGASAGGRTGGQVDQANTEDGEDEDDDDDEAYASELWVILPARLYKVIKGTMKPSPRNGSSVSMPFERHEQLSKTEGRGDEQNRLLRQSKRGSPKREDRNRQRQRDRDRDRQRGPKVGEKVQVEWRKPGGRLYPACVTATNGDGTFDVRFSDGDDERVPVHRICNEDGEEYAPDTGQIERGSRVEYASVVGSSTSSRSSPSGAGAGARAGAGGGAGEGDSSDEEPDEDGGDGGNGSTADSSMLGRLGQSLGHGRSRGRGSPRRARGRDGGRDGGRAGGKGGHVSRRWLPGSVVCANVCGDTNAKKEGQDAEGGADHGRGKGKGKDEGADRASSQIAYTVVNDNGVVVRGLLRSRLRVASISRARAEQQQGQLGGLNRSLRALAGLVPQSLFMFTSHGAVAQGERCCLGRVWSAIEATGSPCPDHIDPNLVELVRGGEPPLATGLGVGAADQASVSWVVRRPEQEQQQELLTRTEVDAPVELEARFSVSRQAVPERVDSGATLFETLHRLADSSAAQREKHLGEGSGGGRGSSGAEPSWATQAMRGRVTIYYSITPKFAEPSVPAPDTPSSPAGNSPRVSKLRLSAVGVPSPGSTSDLLSPRWGNYGRLSHQSMADAPRLNSELKQAGLSSDALAALELLRLLDDKLSPSGEWGRRTAAAAAAAAPSLTGAGLSSNTDQASSSGKKGSSSSSGGNTEYYMEDRYWVNTKLSKKLILQLDDAMAIVSGALPSWCQLILTAYSAQFNFAQRWRFLECTAFGASRTVISLQEKAEEPLRNRLAEARSSAMAALESDPVRSSSNSNSGSFFMCVC
jgi:hypothetical protein